jgi:hypothetical protein
MTKCRRSVSTRIVWASVAICGPYFFEIAPSYSTDSVAIVCVAERGVDLLVGRGNKIVSVDLELERLKYLVRPVLEYKWYDRDVNYEITRSDEKTPAYRCFRGEYQDGRRYDYLSCGIPSENFTVYFGFMNFTEVITPIEVHGTPNRIKFVSGTCLKV